MNKFLLLVCFILIIYDPWFFQSIRGFILGSCISFLLFISKRKYFISDENIFLILLLTLFLVLSPIPTIYNGEFDFSVFLMYLRMLIYALLLYLTYSLIPKQKNLIKYVSLSIYFQFFVFCFCIISPDVFKDFIFSVHTADSLFYDSEQGYRLYIFTSMAFFQLSLFFGFLFNFLLNLHLEKRITIYPIIICFFCGFISGRSFIIFALISILISGFNLRLFIFILFGTIAIYFISIEFQDNKYIHHLLEPIIQYNNNNTLKTNSSDKLINEMLIFPNEKQLFFGDGIYTNNDKSYYMHTDSGYLRQIFYGGFLYLLLCAGFTIYIIKRISSNWFYNKKIRFIFSSILILGIGNIKADSFMYPGITLFFMLLLAFYSKEKE